MPSLPSPAPPSSAVGTVPGRIVRAGKRRRPSGEPPPLPRQLNASGKWWLALAGSVVAFLVVLAATRTTDVTVGLLDRPVLTWFAGIRTSLPTRVMKVVGWVASDRGLQLIWLANALVLLIWRRWRHLFVWIGAMWLVSGLTEIATVLVQRPRPVGVPIEGHWEGFAMPSRPMAVLAAVLIGMLYTLVPAGRVREIGKSVAAGVLALTAVSRLYLAQDGPSDVVLGTVVGIAIPLAMFRLLAPNDVFPVSYRRGRTAHLDIGGRRLEAIVRALQDQLGIVAVEVRPFGLEGSGGSTPLRVKVKGDPDSYVFAKLYAATHLRSDRWYKLGRTLLYGRLEDEASFNSVRRLVQYEDYVLRLLQAARLPVPTPYGIVEITPEREYLLVTEFFDGAREIGAAEVDESVIDQGLVLIRRLWEAGLAHRDIKPANLLVRDGRLLLIDSAFAQVRPSPWRQAVDLGNMMLVLALRTDPRRVYERARAHFTDDEIAEAFAATRGLTMPSQLRRLMRQQGRDLHEEFTRLLPYRLAPVRIQRWSLRRLWLTVGVAVGAFVVVSLGISLLGGPL
jgi:membrane-associated phospholipid phosphatase/tRNA A-37 threonylcarbamoyl transferase component Bud32